jgi:hypothetical protein
MIEILVKLVIKLLTLMFLYVLYYFALHRLMDVPLWAVFMMTFIVFSINEISIKSSME